MSDAAAFSLKAACITLAAACTALLWLWLESEAKGPEYIQLPAETVTVTDTVTVRDTVTLWRAPQPSQDTSAQEGHPE